MLTKKLIERLVKDKIIKEFGSYDRRVHRAIELAQQKTAQAMFSDFWDTLPFEITEDQLETLEEFKKRWDVK